MKNNEIINFNFFDRTYEVKVVSLGENSLDENGNKKEDFDLSEEEVELLNWLMNSESFEQYSDALAGYIDYLYEQNGVDRVVGINELFDEIKITEIVINYNKDKTAYASKDERKYYPDVAVCGECVASKEAGFAMCFLLGRLLGISERNYALQK